MNVRCCLAPEGHAAYCTTTRPVRTGARVGPGHFGTWTDEEVMRSMHEQADACVRIVAMPAEERHRIGKKGEASPEQAGVLNAVIAMHLEREARERGLIA